MDFENVVVQTTHEALSIPIRETFFAQKMLPVYCVCELIRDETGSSPNHERWATLRTYRRTHGMDPADVPLTHTYCQKCVTKAGNTTRQSFRKIGTPS